MDKRFGALFGIIGPAIAFISIGASIVFSPGFSWERSALSDLGHTFRSTVAPIFNLGLLMTGFCTILYAVIVFRKYAKYTSTSLVISGFFLQLIATFDEAYGALHYEVSVFFFVSLGITLIIYTIERKSALAFIAFIIGLTAWAAYWIKLYSAGIAVPETISSLVAAALLISSAIKIYLNPRFS